MEKTEKNLVERMLPLVQWEAPIGEPTQPIEVEIDEELTELLVALIDSVEAAGYELDENMTIDDFVDAVGQAIDEDESLKEASELFMELSGAYGRKHRDALTRHFKRGKEAGFEVARHKMNKTIQFLKAKGEDPIHKPTLKAIRRYHKKVGKRELAQAGKASSKAERGFRHATGQAHKKLAQFAAASVVGQHHLAKKQHRWMESEDPEDMLTGLVEMVMNEGYDVDDDMTVSEFVEAVEQLAESDELDEATKKTMKGASKAVKKLLGIGSKPKSDPGKVTQMPSKKAPKFKKWGAKLPK